MNGDELLEAAHAAAVGIARRAIFAGDRCNWIGATVRETGERSARVDFASLPPHLYDGASGVGLFLAEAAKLTQDREVKRAALASLRSALDRCDGEGEPLSPYLGSLGVVLAAGYVGRILDVGELESRAEQMRRHLSAARPRVAGFDLLSGAAGSILGLLSLYTDYGETAALEIAFRFGEQLTVMAKSSDEGVSWHQASIASAGNLMGLSHGTSGAVAALLELSQATGNADFRNVATRALDYETNHFDPEVGNWPDLRLSRPMANGARRRPSFTAFWCHGAPGVLASRLRLETLLPPEQRRETAPATEAVRRSVLDMLANGDGFSICHGVSGNAEALLLARSSPQEAVSQAVGTLPEDAALAGYERFFVRDGRWPSGVQGAPNPSLFLGDAGAGRLLLRLACPELPSVLLPGPMTTGH